MAKAMNRREFLLKSGAAASLGLWASSNLVAQPKQLGPGTGGPKPMPLVGGAGGPPIHPPAPAVEFKEVRRHVGWFTGRGGTIGWLASPTALVAVDTQFPETAGLFIKDLPGRADRTFDAVINTHHHADHTGGNVTFKPLAKTIVAQANVPELMAQAAKRSPSPMVPTLPTETFPTEWRKTIGDEVVTAKYFRPAHTSGDVAVYFERANVVHTGDLVFNGLYPVIDRAGGGRIKSWILTLEELVKTYPKDAIYIFGHGSQKAGITGDAAAIGGFRDYLAALIAHVEKEIKAGKTKEQITQLANMPGFPALEAPAGPGNRFPGNLATAYDELTSA